ncbi:MAG: TIGR02450 family Trp-rich protein [Paucibacter sp.]|nr:TIGR02450 family Trp-rich protein [Roseateles sp.]
MSSSHPAPPLHPKKLLHSKWTALQPQQRERHFLVSRVIAPEIGPSGQPGPVEWIELEAVLSKRVQRLAWRELRDSERWRQGWLA